MPGKTTSATRRDFLKPNPIKRIKKDVRNLCDSYSHPWDVLAELTQNSVDAIAKWDEQNGGAARKHKVVITVDQARRAVTVEDSGIGFKVADVPELLAPGGTDKDGDDLVIGEKGVGLTFCIFVSNRFHLTTRSATGSYSGTIVLARNWRDNAEFGEDSLPEISEESVSDEAVPATETGTTIALEDVAVGDDFGEEDIFEMSPERLAFLLRTKTAIGRTRLGTRPVPEISVALKHVDKDGQAHNLDIPFSYQYPDEFWKEEDVLDLAEFHAKAALLSDSQKEKRLREKVWKVAGTEEYKGKTISYHALFVPSREDWAHAAERHGLAKRSTEGTLEFCDVHPGIWVATKGMPTGIELVAPTHGVGEAGYFLNLFFLAEYDRFTFDVGRKSIPGRTQGFLKEFVQAKFRLFLQWRKFVRDHRSPDPKPPQVASLQKSQTFESLKSAPELGLKEIGFQKIPGGQEAGVAAIFHELIGDGALACYKCLRTGYKQNYDFWGEYAIATDKLGTNVRKGLDADLIKVPVVIEFKFDAASIIADIHDEAKYFEDIDLIVCWTLDREKLEAAGILVTPLKDDDRFFLHSQYQLKPQTGGEKPVLVLERLVEELRRKA